jgi:flagellar basal body-associated protein FliL
MARTPTIRTPTEKVARLRVLEERLRHELMDDEERQELRDRVLRLRRRLGL